MDLSHCCVFMQTVKTTLYLQNFSKQWKIKTIQEHAFGCRDANLKCADFTVNGPGRKAGTLVGSRTLQNSNAQQPFLDVILC